MPRTCSADPRSHPSAGFIIGHYALAYAGVVNQSDNMLQCTCAPLGYRSVEALVDRVDPARIVFGSDLTDLDPALGLAPIACADIKESVKRQILGGNMRRVLEGIRPEADARHPGRGVIGSSEKGPAP